MGLGAFGESTLGRTILKQPSLPLDYEFLKGALLAAQSPSLAWNHLFGRPLPLIGGEKLNIEVENATDEDGICFLALGSGKITQAMLDAVNPTHIITGYADTTATAFTWSALTMTWQQDLPEGFYEVVGMVYSYWLTTAPTMPSAARLTFKTREGAHWRPGVLGNYIDKDHEELQTGDYFPARHWPLMGLRFPHDQMPGIEVCSAEAHTDENIELLLQKVG